MRVAHLLRKYNPAEWGGTETALKHLFDGLELLGVTPVIYFPHQGSAGHLDPFAQKGYPMRPFHACLPYLGLSRAQKNQMIAVGGNLMSFDLPLRLWREPGLDLIHSHALGRLGGIGLTLAKRRHLPFVVTIHGGVLDLPPALKERFQNPPRLGWEWGKIFGALFHSRQMLAEADAILTCNLREANLLQAKYPDRRIQVQPHGVVMTNFENDCRLAARRAFPRIAGAKVLLTVGRIDPVKNQIWLVERMPAVLFKHPDALLVLAGACTHQEFGRQLEERIRQLSLADHVLLTGGLAPDDPRLIGLFQETQVVILPSLAETFGLVLLEAWAARKPVLSSRTSGASALVRSGENGWLFDLADPRPFHFALERLLLKSDLAQALGHAGHALALSQYDTRVLAERMKKLYADLIEEKYALRHSAGR